MNISRIVSDARETAAQLFEAAGLFAEQRPMATTAELAQALSLPLYAVRECALEVGAQRIGHAIAVAEERALDCAEELARRGYAICNDTEE
jgi:hypothetical protein